MTTVILLEPIFPKTDICCNCECEVVIKEWAPNFGIPMYEGIPVPPEWKGPWAGFCACEMCFDIYEKGMLDMWPLDSHLNDERYKL